MRDIVTIIIKYWEELLYDVGVSLTKYLVEEKLNVGEQVEAGWMEL